MDYQKIERAAALRKKALNILIYSFLGIWGLLVLFPFYWMLLTSVKSYGAYNSEFIPKLYTLSPTLQNFADAFTAVPLGRYFVNTIVFTVLTTALMLIVTVLAAFAFARLNFRGKELVFTLFLSLMMIPSELVVITNFVTVTNLDPALGNQRVLHLPAEGELLPGAGRAVLRRQGGRHLGHQVSVPGAAAHLQAYRDHRHHSEGH